MSNFQNDNLVVNLTVIIEGKSLHYSISRHAIYILWHPGLGVYLDERPPLESILTFFNSPMLSTCCLPGHTVDAAYGNLSINFDHRCIIDHNTFGNPLRMNAKWVIDIINGEPGMCPEFLSLPSITGLLDLGQIFIEPSVSGVGQSQLLAGIDDTISIMEGLDDIGNIERFWLKIEIPRDWSFISS